MPASRACLKARVRRAPRRHPGAAAGHAAADFPPRLTDRLEQWALQAPERTLAARRDRGGDWIRVSYAQMLDRARAVGQALVDRGLSADRPVAILSENGLEHLTLALGAMWAGIPFVPISSAYSLISQDYGKLHHILGRITPGLVFASGAAYARAIDGDGRPRHRGGDDGIGGPRAGGDAVRRACWPRSRVPGSTRPMRAWARRPSSSSCSPPARPSCRRASSTPTA